MSWTPSNYCPFDQTSNFNRDHLMDRSPSTPSRGGSSVTRSPFSSTSTTPERIFTLTPLSNNVSTTNYSPSGIRFPTDFEAKIKKFGFKTNEDYIVFLTAVRRCLQLGDVDADNTLQQLVNNFNSAQSEDTEVKQMTVKDIKMMFATKKADFSRKLMFEDDGKESEIQSNTSSLN